MSEELSWAPRHLASCVSPTPTFPGLSVASWAAIPRTSDTVLVWMSSGPLVYGSLLCLDYLHSMSLSRDVDHANVSPIFTCEHKYVCTECLWHTVLRQCEGCSCVCTRAYAHVRVCLRIFFFFGGEPGMASHSLVGGEVITPVTLEGPPNRPYSLSHFTDLFFCET